MIYLLYSRQSPNTENQYKQIELNIWIQDSSDAVNTYFTQAKERFEQANEGISIKFKMIQGSDTKAINYMNTEIINRISPDILCLSLHNYNQYASENRLYNLNDYLSTYDDDYFLDSAIRYGIYNNNSYGIAYSLDPEILVYRKDFLSALDIPFPEEIESLNFLYTYLEEINSYFLTDNLNKVAFSIPTLISNGTFLSSILNTSTGNPTLSVNKTEDFEKTLFTVSSMYHSFDVVPYDYGKVGIHPFFSGEATFSIEPLSSVYSSIEKDNNLLRNIGIVSLEKSSMKLSYSKHKYITIMSGTQYPEEALIFLDFFFSESEVIKRYRSLNLPVVLNSLTDYYLSDSKFNNTTIIEYIKNSFHYPISPNMPEFLKELDKVYDTTINSNLMQE